MYFPKLRKGNFYFRTPIVLSAFLIQCLKLNPSTLLVYQELLNGLRQIVRQEDLALGFDY